MDRCSCDAEHELSYEQFQRKSYNEEIAKRNKIIQDLEKEYSRFQRIIYKLTKREFPKAKEIIEKHHDKPWTILRNKKPNKPR